MRGALLTGFVVLGLAVPAAQAATVTFSTYPCDPQAGKYGQCQPPSVTYAGGPESERLTITAPTPNTLLFHDDAVAITAVGCQQIDAQTASCPGGTGFSNSVTMGEGDDVVTDTAGLTVAGGGGADTLIGSPQGDTLSGGPGDDSIAGLEGNDRLRPGPGANKVDGGTGEDAVLYDDAAAGVTVNLEDPGADAGGDTLTNLEDVGGSKGDDKLTGDSGPNKVYGLQGRDAVDGAAGPDNVVGGPDADSVNGGAGDDIVNASGYTPDVYSFGDTTSTFTDARGEAVDCGEGNDRVAQNFDVLANCERLELGFVVAGSNPLLPPLGDLTLLPDREALSRKAIIFGLPCGSSLSSRGVCKYRITMRVGGKRVLDRKRTVRRSTRPRRVAYGLRRTIPAGARVDVVLQERKLGFSAPFGTVGWSFTQ